MSTRSGSRRLLVVTLLLLACSEATGPDGRIETVDAFLARLCELAADCPGLSSTAADLADCPFGIRSELSAAQLIELEQFTAYTKVQQDHILECMDEALCGRFGGSVANISDSDILEPFRACRSSV